MCPVVWWTGAVPSGGSTVEIEDTKEARLAMATFIADVGSLAETYATRAFRHEIFGTRRASDRWNPKAREIYRARRVVTAMDVAQALRWRGRSIYGFVGHH